MAEKKSLISEFIPQKGDSPNDIARKMVTIIASVVLVAALGYLAVRFIGQVQNRQAIKDRQNAFENITVINPVTEAAEEDEPDETVVTEPPPLVMLDAFNDFMADNPETAGWIKVPNTSVNDVVVQTDNNTYYMDKDFYGNRNIAGTIFVDYRCVINDYDFNQTPNVILYGHNQADSSMFGSLKKYKVKKDNTKNFSFYQENPTFTFTSLYGEYTYKIIALFVIEALPEQTRDGNLFDYHNYITFTGERNFEKFKENIMLRTGINTGVDFDENDKYMTLSTCSNEFDQSRFIVIGRRVRPGESPEVDTSLAEINEDMLEPDYSYIYSR
ncbi:MAG: class B sortase [Oscillospiraceae bacterium]|nr:class B sortase [Oscillospiraceae bacterium]